MTRRLLKFDVQAAIPEAWDFLWSDNLARRAKGEDYRGSTYHLTAADVENQVRQFAYEAAHGQKRGTRAWGRPCSLVRISGDLQGRVRSWLQGQVSRGVLVTHNFGRGHISGARFRPKGEPLSPAEEKTFQDKAARKDRPRPVHLARRSGSGISCRPAPKGFSYGRGGAQAMRSTNPERVTCPHCLKIIAASPSNERTAKALKSAAARPSVCE